VLSSLRSLWLQALLEEASSACISMLPTGLGAAISRLADVDDWDLVTPTGQSGTRRRCPNQAV